MKLGIQVALFHQSLAFQVFEQDINTHNDVIYETNDGFKFKTESEPEIGGNYMYLRGDSYSKNWNSRTRLFDDEVAKKNYRKRIITGLQEWADDENMKFKIQDLGHTQLLHLKS